MDKKHGFLHHSDAITSTEFGHDKLNYSLQIFPENLKLIG